MSKLKIDLIQKQYKDNILCKNNHPINWVGLTYLHSYGLKCDKCGADSCKKQPIRWACEKCQLYYCRFCIKLISDKYCPRRHKLKFSNQSTVDFFSNFTCDICFKKFETKNGVLYDKDCDLTICANCYYESNDIPEILED